MTPKVLHLVISLAPGGLERLVVDWTHARNQRLPGSTQICCLDQLGELAQQIEDGPVFCVNAHRNRWPWDRFAVRHISERLHTQHYILHAHNLAAWQYGVLAKIKSPHLIRLIYTQHGVNVHNMSLRDRLRARILACFTDEIVAVSEATATSMSQSIWLPRQRIKVVANGVGSGQKTEDRKHKSECRAQLKIPATAKVIGSVGRLAPIKGYDRLITAFAGLTPAHSLSKVPNDSRHSPAATNNQQPTTILLLVGDGSERKQLERLAQTLGVESQVLFTGYQADPTPFLTAMNLFVLPSRSEGMSVALLEAMAAGVPVAATNVGANREILESGKFGVVLPEGESEWVGLISGLLRNREPTLAKAAAARQHVSTHYSLEATMKAYEELYVAGCSRKGIKLGEEPTPNPSMEGISDVLIPSSEGLGVGSACPPLITISNLFPRPDQPTRGLYNLRLFKEMEGSVRIQNSEARIQNDAGITQPLTPPPPTHAHFINICLVPEWRLWRWAAIRRWQGPEQETLPTLYLPVFYLPWLGRSWNDHFYSLTLSRFLSKSAGSGLVPYGLNHSHFGHNFWKKIFEQKPAKAAKEKNIAPAAYSPLAPLRASRASVQNLPLGPDYAELRSKDASPTVYYVPWLYPDGVAVARAIQRTDAKLWLMALGSDTLHLKSWLRRHKILQACHQAEGIICVAQILADRLAKAGVPRAKLHVVPNGVDTALFHARGKEESPAGTATILFIGNLVPVKGPDVMIKAFAMLGGALKTEEIQNPPLPLRGGDLRGHPRLIIIGDGPMRASLEQLATNLGVADHTQFLGRRTPVEVAGSMNQADILCLSSRSEGMPNVILEARACGLPVVTTPAGAIPELSLDKKHFLVVKSYSPAALAEGLKEMLARDLTHRTSDPAILSWRNMAERILEEVRRET